MNTLPSVVPSSSAPLYLLPGWGLGHGPMQPLADALQQRDPARRVILLDLPGYGETPFTADPMAATNHLLQVIEPGAVLLGWSLGGMLALAAAAQSCRSQPDSPVVGKLILMGSTPSFIVRPDWSTAMPGAELAAFREAIATDAEAMLPRFIGGFNRGDVRARAVTRELLERASPRPDSTVLLAGLDWLRDLDLRTALADIRQPLLILHGLADPLMPFAAAAWLAAQCRIQSPDVRLHGLPGCAHAPFVSDLPACLGHLSAFLDGRV